MQYFRTVGVAAKRVVVAEEFTLINIRRHVDTRKSSKVKEN